MGDMFESIYWKQAENDESENTFKTNAKNLQAPTITSNLFFYYYLLLDKANKAFSLYTETTVLVDESVA